jgi:dienelactone hydrolase
MIVFSHGFGGCATQSRFLAAALADRGYWVFAPNHKDARRGRRGGGVKPDEPFREPEKSVSRSLCRGQAAAAILTKTESGISELRYQSELGTSQPPPPSGRR